MNDQIQEGSVVRLKSGGPEMTVCDVVPTMNMCRCVWFAGNNVIRDDFRVTTLRIVSEDRKPWVLT